MQIVARPLALIASLGAVAPMAALPPALAGCVYVEEGGEDDPVEPHPGHVEVSWAMGGRTCSEAALATVRATATDLEGTVHAEASGACGDRQALLGPLTPGVYRIEIQGRSADGVVTHTGGMEGVVVAEGMTSEPSVVNLRAQGATLKVTWRFANGGLCSFNAIDAVQVAVFDDLSREVHLMNYACDPDGPVRITEVPSGEVDIIATGLDTAGRALFQDHERIETGFGQESDVALVLEGCERRKDGC